MIYQIETRILEESAKILVKEKDQRYFTYKPIKKIVKMLAEKKVLYSLGFDLALNKILDVQFVGLQDFFEVKTFSGSKIKIGIDAEIYVDGEWVRVEEILFHEKIYEYNMLQDVFRDTFITHIDKSGNYRAYKISIERPEGIVINNLIVRFESEIDDDALPESTIVNENS